MPPSVRTAATAFALVLALAGCSLGGSPDSKDSEADGDAAEESGAGQEPGAPASDDVIAEGTFSYPDRDGEVTFEINALEVRGKLLQLDYTMTAQSPGSNAKSNPRLNDIFDIGMNDQQMYLVDMANLRRHTVVSDDKGTRLQPRRHTEVSYDKPVSFTAFFAAPEEKVDEMDLYLYDFQPIMNIPVEVRT